MEPGRANEELSVQFVMGTAIQRRCVHHMAEGSSPGHRQARVLAKTKTTKAKAKEKASLRGAQEPKEANEKDAEMVGKARARADSQVRAVDFQPPSKRKGKGAWPSQKGSWSQG